MSKNNLETVQQIYRAFGTGDGPAILEHVAPDCVWEYAYGDATIPWLAPGKGRDHVAGFLRTAGEQLQFNRFEVVQLLPGDGVVIALCSLECIVRATGKKIVETEEPQIWYFDARGQVNRFRHAADTLQQWRALQR